MVKLDKAERVIQKALEGYKPLAERKVKEELCADCRDRRCEKGKPCKQYHRSVEAEAWDMVSHENN
jgi:hypothetical protein